MKTKHKDIREFLELRPVFTLPELRREFGISISGREAYDMIRYHKTMGRLGVIKEGLYFAIRPGQVLQSAPVDPFLLESRLAPDAVLAYKTALDLMGFGHGDFNTYYCFSDRFHPAFRFRREMFRVILTPLPLQKRSQQCFGTDKIERSGVKVLATGKERTLAECLERPKLCGGFEELYRSLEKIPFIQPGILKEYLTLRGKKNLHAIVGFFLEQHRNTRQISEDLLDHLASRVPAQPVYWTPQGRGGVLVKRWNLIVPEAVFRRAGTGPGIKC